MSSEDDFLSSAVKGTLSYGEDKIKEWARKFKNKELAFIQDEATIDLVKEQLKSGEWDLCKKYLRDDKLQILVQLGLTLRTLDGKKDKKAIQSLKEKILKTHGTRGIHVSQFVQNKILSEFIGSYVSQNTNVEDLIINLELLLNNIDKYVLFVKAEDNPRKLVEDAYIKLTANVPEVFIIFARESALSNGQRIQDTLLLNNDLGYEIEIKQERKQLLMFLFKKKEI